MSGGVFALVVTYHPQASELQSLLQLLAPQVDHVLVVDNTPGTVDGIERLLTPLRGIMPHLRLQRTGRNLGIAAAQNIGIRMALDEGFDYVFFSDQDSLPDAGMVASLRDCCTQLQEQGARVACVCPEYFDETTSQMFRLQVQVPGRLFYRSMRGDPEVLAQEIITTISSGTLVPRAALEQVGGMREDFFIDHVDTEWCLRARALGLHNYATARARLVHRLGDSPFRAWYLGWRSHNGYSPVRLYYRFRNFVLLCRLPHVPLRWSLRAGWYWLGNAYAQCLFARHRAASARAIALGLWDGLRGRSGPIRRAI